MHSFSSHLGKAVLPFLVLLAEDWRQSISSVFPSCLKLNAVLPPYLSFRWDSTTVRCLHERPSSFCSRKQLEANDPGCCNSSHFVSFPVVQLELLPWAQLTHGEAARLGWQPCWLLGALPFARRSLTTVAPPGFVPGQKHRRYLGERKAFSPKLLQQMEGLFFFYSGWRLCLGCKPGRFKHLLFLLLFRPVLHILREQVVCQVIRNHYFATELLNGCANRCLSGFAFWAEYFWCFRNFYVQSTIALCIGERLIQIIQAIREQRCGSVIHNWNLAFRLTSLVCCWTRTEC